MRNDDGVRVLCCLKFFKPQAKAPVEVNMGNSQSGKSEYSSPISSPQHQLHLPVDLPRTHSLRASIRTKIPMPDKSELERRFTKVLVSYIFLKSTYAPSFSLLLNMNVVRIYICIAFNTMKLGMFTIFDGFFYFWCNIPVCLNFKHKLL